MGFNPSVGILHIETVGISAALAALDPGFNPSVGILHIETYHDEDDAAMDWFVSIPQSGFSTLKPGSFLAGGGREGTVSIPQSGFSTLKPQ